MASLHVTCIDNHGITQATTLTRMDSGSKGDPLAIMNINTNTANGVINCTPGPFAKSGLLQRSPPKAALGPSISGSPSVPTTGDTSAPSMGETSDPTTGNSIAPPTIEAMDITEEPATPNPGDSSDKGETDTPSTTRGRKRKLTPKGVLGGTWLTETMKELDEGQQPKLKTLAEQLDVIIDWCNKRSNIAHALKISLMMLRANAKKASEEFDKLTSSAQELSSTTEKPENERSVNDVLPKGDPPKDDLPKVDPPKERPPKNRKKSRGKKGAAKKGEGSNQTPRCPQKHDTKVNQGKNNPKTKSGQPKGPRPGPSRNHGRPPDIITIINQGGAWTIENGTPMRPPKHDNKVNQGKSNLMTKLSQNNGPRPGSSQDQGRTHEETSQDAPWIEVVNRNKQRNTKLPIQRRDRNEVVIVKTDETSYADVLKRMRQEEKLSTMNDDVSTIRRSRAGELMLVLNKDSKLKSSEYQQLIGDFLGETAQVRAPATQVTIQCKGCDFLTVPADVATALSTRGVEVPTASIKMSKGPSGTLVATFKLPSAEADKALAGGKLGMSYSKCRLRVIQPNVVCFQCFRVGHQSWDCKGPDRSKLCRRCGCEGHKAQSCDKAPKCLDCSGNRRHITGGPRCPKMRRALEKASSCK